MKIRILLIITFCFLYKLSYAQFKTEGEYSFTSRGYYIGKLEHMKNDAVTKSPSEIHISGASSNFQSIHKLTAFDPYSYRFVNAYTDDIGRGIWICDADKNNGLQKIIYDPKSMIIDFKFNDGTSQIFFQVKRVK